MQRDTSTHWWCKSPSLGPFTQSNLKRLHSQQNTTTKSFFLKNGHFRGRCDITKGSRSKHFLNCGERRNKRSDFSHVNHKNLSLCCVIRKYFIQKSESSCWTHQTTSLAKTVLTSVNHWHFAALILNHSNTSRCCCFGCKLLGNWTIWWINLWSESFYCTNSPICNNFYCVDLLHRLYWELLKSCHSRG